MLKELNTIRLSLDELLAKVDLGQSVTQTQSALKKSLNKLLSTISPERSKAKLWGWVPLITALCPSELGTSSDLNCSRPSRPNNSPYSPSMQHSAGYDLAVNPF